jgi:hypothetical protein
MKLTRKDAIKIILNVTDKDDPYWDDIVDDWYDEDNDEFPTIYDVFEALGITKKEIDKIEGGVL